MAGSIPDLINAGFEALAALFILNHCRVMWRDRQARGVSTVSTAFFLAWGFWNVVFYPAVGLHLSFVAGIAVCAANALWLGLMIYFRKREA